MPTLEPIQDPLQSAQTSAPYSAAIRAGTLLFLSGQQGRDALTGTVPPTIEEQTRLALENLGRVLDASGASLVNVASMTIFLARNEDRQGMNLVYREVFGDHKPARSTVVVGLGTPELLIEMQALAIL